MDKPFALASARLDCLCKIQQSDAKRNAQQAMLSQLQGTVFPAVSETPRHMATSEFATTNVLLTRLLLSMQTTLPICA